MKIKLLLSGAAGCKAGITAIEKGIVTKEQCLIINSTLRDVPPNYRDIAVELLGSRGAGKERGLAKQLCLETIQEGKLDELDALITDEDELVVLVSSSEGGTGSGSLPILAKYYRHVIDIPVHCFVFTGFEEDGKGMQNTIEFFQEMEEDYTVQAISNKKFLDTCAGNKLRAEKAANEEFADRISILIGNGRIESEQNIDDTDLYKVSTTPGYMMIGKANLDRVKNTEQFDRIVSDMIDNNVSLDSHDLALKRLGVFLNVNSRTGDIVDYNFTVFKNKLGVPYELFTHVQYDENQPESIAFIASGMNMPLDEVKDIYEKYQRETAKINTNKDKFFEFASGLKIEENKKQEKIKEMFQMKMPAQQEKKEVQEIVKDKKEFLNSFGVSFGRKSQVNNTPQQQTVVSDSLSGNNNTNKVKLTREEYLKNNF